MTPRKSNPAISLTKYREQYGVIVICQDERDQKAIYERLRAIGRPLRVVTT